MAREIREVQNYQDRLLKLIPTEIVGAYLFLQGIIPDNQAKWGTSITSLLLLILTPFYLQRIQKVNKSSQLIITTLSFAVWVYSLGGPFQKWGIYQPWIGSAVLVFWTLVVPLFFGSETKIAEENTGISS